MDKGFIVEVRNLTKFYGPKKAIDGVTFTLSRGEILGFLGPNAAGKTTTMRIITGYMPPSEGTVVVDGYDVLENSLEVRRRIGYMPETVPLYPELTVRQYLNYVASLKGLSGRQRKTRVDDVMEKCWVSDVADTLIYKLSKGYRQRVGLAQALVSDPPVLVLDEPTVGLDPRQIIETRQLIKGLAGSHSVILSTHILPEVSMTCDRVLIINEGNVVAEDTPQNLERRLRGTDSVLVEVRGPQEAVVQELRSLPRVLGVHVQEAKDQKVRLVVETELGSDIRELVAEAVVKGGWGLLELRPTSMTLEEIFLKLTTREELGAR
jgi:ABC-2 type transport system ATP-binding protein